jgi:YggT family protein
LSIQAAIIQLFNLLELLLVIRILLSWFPNIDWYKQPFKLLNAITEPILAPFRKIIPNLGGMDISPIFAFIVLEMLQTVLLGLLGNV